MSNIEKSDSSSRDGIEVSNALHTAEQRKTDSDFRDANSYGNSGARQEHGTVHGSGDQQVYTEQTTIPIAYMEGSREYPRQELRILPSHRPMEGQWKDGICDCCINIWPSCFCSFFICSGVWVLAQIAQKSGFTSFQNVMVPYVIGSIICYGVLLGTGRQFFWALFICVIILQICIRLHFVRKYEINSQSSCTECVTGLCCTPCSIAQMARHTVGYKKIFDGDSDVTMPDQYNDHV